MDITVIYFIKQLLLPPAGLLLLLWAGLIWRRKPWGLPLMFAGSALLWLLSLPVVVHAVAAVWERFPVLSSAQLADFKPQALVLIGGGLTAHATEYQQPMTLNARSLLRLRYAAKVARETGLPVLVAGGRVLADAELSEAQVMAAALQNEFNVQVRWQEDASRNTAENARYSYQRLQPEGITRIVLVTQAYHMPRALFEFRRAGFSVLPAPTDFMRRSGTRSVMNWLPSATALQNNFLMFHEMLGMIWYRLRYA